MLFTSCINYHIFETIMKIFNCPLITSKIFDFQTKKNSKFLFKLLTVQKKLQDRPVYG